jgi:quercetin dioxygenase-like cupin family protein
LLLFLTAPATSALEGKNMADTTVTKVDSRHSPVGPDGQKYLASSVHMGMRLWDEVPSDNPKPHATRDYETIGYVIKGRAELEVEGQTVKLEAGDSWVVPKGARHTYRITEPFTAVETTHPPSHVHGRDDHGK